MIGTVTLPPMTNHNRSVSIATSIMCDKDLVEFVEQAEESPKIRDMGDACCLEYRNIKRINVLGVIQRLHEVDVIVSSFVYERFPDTGKHKFILQIARGTPIPSSPPPPPPTFVEKRSSRRVWIETSLMMLFVVSAVVAAVYVARVRGW